MISNLNLNLKTRRSVKKMVNLLINLKPKRQFYTVIFYCLVNKMFAIFFHKKYFVNNISHFNNKGFQ